MKKDDVNGGNGQEEPLIINKLNYDDEKIIQQNFVDQLLEELRKVQYFFSENLKHYKKHSEAIGVKFKIINDL